MPSLSTLKKRMASVQAISKMTRAMELISGVKMRRAKRLLAEAMPYTINCVRTMEHVLMRAPGLQSPFLSFRDKNPGDAWRVVLYVLTDDQGLDGSYSQDVVRHVVEFLSFREQELKQIGFRPEVDIRVMGRVGRDLLTRMGYQVTPEFTDSLREPTYYGASDLAERILARYTKQETDEVLLVYSSMRSPISWTPIYTRILPADFNALDYWIKRTMLDPEIKDALPADFSIEGPSAQFDLPEDIHSLLVYLFGSYLAGMVFGALVQAYASEQTARMISMDGASKNSSDLLASLRRTSNRLRQQAITNELVEITAGAEAMPMDGRKSG